MAKYKKRWLKIGLLLSFLLIAGGCTEDKQEIEIKGIGVPMDSLLFVQGNTQAAMLLDEATILQKVIERSLDYGYVRIELAIDRYVNGAPIVALSGAQDPDQQIWMLVAHRDMLHTQPERVKEFVQQFAEDTRKRGWTLVPWSENEIVKTLGIKEKVNLSWFVDPYFYK
ncbi:hypothetical protein [Ammoniphilus sp. YIM 78166]|uniref:hypothetical protein n=1 Tax=Ammoniphilus sp. YIM 78166 TaxID=1644106 RepID=UPI0010705788|nr:hypothetical protein [Ammoniphilus sp. YIM 78166]